MSSDGKFCDPCSSENVEISAAVHCLDCQENLCEQCQNVHKKIRSSRNHKICALEDAPSAASTVLVESLTTCPKHVSEKAVFLCQDHDLLCCNECALLSHRKCESLDTLANIAKGENNKQEELSQFGEMLKSYEKHAKVLLEHEKARSSEIQQSDISKVTFSKIKCIFDSALQKLEVKMTSEFKGKQQNLLQTISKQTEDLAAFLANVKQANEDIEAVLKQGENTNIYLLDRSLKRTKMVVLEESISALHHGTTNKVLKYTDTREIEDLVKSIETVIQVKTVYQEYSISDYPMNKHFQERVPTLTGSVNLMDESYTGEYYPDHCLWVRGYVIAAILSRRCIKLVDPSTAEVVHTYDCSSDPYSVAALDWTTVMVCFPDINQIDILDISDGELTYTRTIETEHKIHDTFYMREQEKIVALSRETGCIYILDRNGSCAATVPLNKDGIDAVKTAYKFTLGQHLQNIYVSCFDKHKVVAMDMDGKDIFEYEHENLGSPDGSNVDTFGNLYVVSSDGHSVHQLSKTGEHIRVLLKDELYYPRCLSFNHTLDKFAVIDETAGKHLKICSFL